MFPTIKSADELSSSWDYIKNAIKWDWFQKYAVVMLNWTSYISRIYLLLSLIFIFDEFVF